MLRNYLLLSLFVLASCATIKEKVGLVKEQPDEYQVVTNPPLSVPKDLVDLPAPEEAASHNAKNYQDKTNLSKGENILLKNLNK